jgi:hypothetical protein
MSLISAIASISEHIRKNSYRNESAVREAIVNRILHELGWDIYDPSVVQREYAVEKRRVDYALFTSARSPAVFVEVKAPNSGEDGDRQLFEYAFHHGTPFAVLVNGRDWSFYLPAEQGDYSERRVQKVDLVERKPEDSANVFERYLRFQRVQDGSAYADARSDYQSAARQRDAVTAIPRAWLELVTKTDELLIELIAEKVAGLIGFRPTDEQIEAFLVKLNVGASEARQVTKRHVLGVPPATRARSSSAPEPDYGVFPPAIGRSLSFRLFGQAVTRPDAISALVYILKKLAARDPHFLAKFAKQAIGKRID